MYTFQEAETSKASLNWIKGERISDWKVILKKNFKKNDVEERGHLPYLRGENGT